MKIVGVGCGPGMLTEQAILEIARASVIYGSPRAIDLVKSSIPPGCTVKAIDDFKQLDKLHIGTLPDSTVILSTGDPMLAGLGYLSGTVIPGISSFQLAAARLKIPISRISVVVAHGKGHEKGREETLEEVKRGKIVFLLADPKFDARKLYADLSALSLPLTVALCENLGYPDECILIRDIQSPPPPTEDLYSLVIGVF
jgi:cobalt-precorrin-7 (C5)-methyltransferase